jgi:hypothetical protein
MMAQPRVRKASWMSSRISQRIRNRRSPSQRAQSHLLIRNRHPTGSPPAHQTIAHAPRPGVREARRSPCYGPRCPQKSPRTSPRRTAGRRALICARQLGHGSVALEFAAPRPAWLAYLYVLCHVRQRTYLPRSACHYRGSGQYESGGCNTQNSSSSGSAGCSSAIRPRWPADRSGAWHQGSAAVAVQAQARECASPGAPGSCGPYRRGQAAARSPRPCHRRAASSGSGRGQHRPGIYPKRWSGMPRSVQVRAVDHENQFAPRVRAAKLSASARTPVSFRPTMNRHVGSWS